LIPIEHAVKDFLAKGKFESAIDRINKLKGDLKEAQRGIDRMTTMIATADDVNIIESYEAKQKELSVEISLIEAKIETAKRESKGKRKSYRYLKKLLEETEKIVAELKKLEESGDVDELRDRFTESIIPSIQEAVENITDFKTRQEVLSAVVAPENGGRVFLNWDKDETEEFEVEFDGEMSIQRVANIIKRIRGGVLSGKVIKIRDDYVD
jgi:chromosome segregation ATPase